MLTSRYLSLRDDCSCLATGASERRPWETSACRMECHRFADLRSRRATGARAGTTLAGERWREVNGYRPWSRLAYVELDGH